MSTKTKTPTEAQRRTREAKALLKLAKEMAEYLRKGRVFSLNINYSKTRRSKVEWPRVPINIKLTYDDDEDEPWRRRVSGSHDGDDE